MTSVMKTLLGDRDRFALTVEVLEARAETLGTYESAQSFFQPC